MPNAKGSFEKGFLSVSSQGRQPISSVALQSKSTMGYERSAVGGRPTALDPKTSMPLKRVQEPCAPTTPDWTTAAGLAPVQSFPAATVLFKQGAGSQHVFFLERGLVKISHMDASGQEMIISLMSAPGSIMGASCAVLEKHIVTATVLARSQLRQMASTEFRSLINRNPDMSWYIHQMHCRILSRMITQRSQMGALSVRRRLEQLFWKLIDSLDLRTGGEVRLELPLKYWEVAQLIVVTPEHLSRVVKAMEKDGLLRREKGGALLFPDPSKLWHSADA